MFHDASTCVIEDGEILFAGHSERYSRVKNDAYLNQRLMKDTLKYGLPDIIVLHESSKLKNKRRLKINRKRNQCKIRTKLAQE